MQCYQLIFVDQKHSYVSLANHCGFLHPLLSPTVVLVARVSILSGKLFFLNYFSVPVPVSGRSLGWSPHFRVAMDTSLQPMESGTLLLTFKVPIVHFRVPPGLCFKMRVGAQPLIWKSFFILMQIKLIFTKKVVHLASF